MRHSKYVFAGGDEPAAGKPQPATGTDGGDRAEQASRRQAAAAGIRRFRGRDDLAVSFQSTSSNPYKDDGSKIDIYADNESNEYWVDPQDGALVQMGPQARADQKARKVGPDDRLPVADLRDKALTLAEAVRPGFGARRSSLHPLEDNKDRQIYFFRWDDFSAPLKESELPPFIQIGLSADGRLVSLTNTLNK